MALSEEKMTREIREMRTHLETYRPGQEPRIAFNRRGVAFPEHLYIGLFGRTGCGKTSLINSLKFAVSGSYRKGQWYPVSNHETGRGHTLFRVVAPLESNIFVLDNRGIADLTKEATLEEIKAQMDGKRGYSTEVEWGKPRRAADRDDFIPAEDRKKYSLGCAVFVFSARDNSVRITEGLREAVDFFKVQQGRYPVAVLTHVDVVDNRRVEILNRTLKDRGISEIFEVANIIETRTDLETRYQHSLLTFLERCMTDGDAYAVFNHHRQNEQAAKKAAEQRRWNAKKGITVATGIGAMIGSIAGPFGIAVGGAVGAIAGTMVFPTQ